MGIRASYIIGTKKVQETGTIIFADDHSMSINRTIKSPWNLTIDCHHCGVRCITVMTRTDESDEGFYWYRSICSRCDAKALFRFTRFVDLAKEAEQKAQRHRMDELKKDRAAWKREDQRWWDFYYKGAGSPMRDEWFGRRRDTTPVPFPPPRLGRMRDMPFASCFREIDFVESGLTLEGFHSAKRARP